MMKKRLERLELILKQKSVGTNDEYMEAIQRETARIRAAIEGRIQGVDIVPEPQNAEDRDIISRYEEFYPIPKDTRAMERITAKIEDICKRMGTVV